MMLRPHLGYTRTPRHLSTLINQEIVGFQVSMGNAMFTSRRADSMFVGQFQPETSLAISLSNYLIFGLEIYAWTIFGMSDC